MVSNFPDIPLALAYDDVLLVPQASDIASRSHVSTRSRLAGDIWLERPIIASNMDTVTMSDMAIAMALEGGIGLLHRFLTIDDNVKEVMRVKRHRSHIIENPYTIHPQQAIAEAVADMDRYEVGGLLVVNDHGQLIGIITRRDIDGEEDTNTVADVMTERENMIVGGAGTSPGEARKMMHARRVEKLPLVDADERPFGLIVMKDIHKLEQHPHATLDAGGRLAVGGSIGVVGDYLERCEALVEAGADVVVLDVAHGWANHVLTAIRQVRQAYPDLPLIVGNVATGEGVRAMAEAAGPGCGVRVGIGGGSACDTRQVAGSGLPMVTSVMDSAIAAREVDAYVIADGGIRIAADVAKAIGAGAHTAMLGSLLASAKEAPGDVVTRNGQRYRVYRGMASREAAQRRWAAEGRLEKLQEDFTPEGIESAVRYNGDTVKQIISPLIGGLKSGMSYAGARDIDEFHQRARFARMTSAGIGESHTHVQNRA